MLYLFPLLVILAGPILASILVKYNYKKYLRVANARGLTGEEVAKSILDKNGISNVKVKCAKGFLSDNYSHGNGRQAVNLSEDVYKQPTIASIAIAAHECGHALQDRDGYSFMRLRSSLVPIVSFANKLSYLLLIAGIIFPFFGFGWIGVIVLGTSLVFELCTLPVEFDASKRALAELEEMGLIDEQESKGVRSMLRSAAWTYVAAVAATAGQLLRLLLVMKGRR